MIALFPFIIALLFLPPCALPLSPNTADSLLKAGYCEIRPDTAGPALAPSPSDRQNGFILFQRQRNREFYPWSRPQKDERLDTFRLCAARGGRESAGFGIHALKDLAVVSVNSAPETETGKDGWTGRECLVEDVVFHVIRGNRRRDGDSLFIRFPVFLDSVRRKPVKAGESRFFWVSLAVPESLEAGRYTGSVILSVENRERRIPLSVRVLPFALTERNLPAFGAFISRGGYSIDEMKFLKKSGIDALQWFWAANRIGILNDGGRLKMDFTRIDAFMARMKESGMKGPVVLSLGNDKTGHYERDLCNAFHLPLHREVIAGKKITVADTACPSIDSLFICGVRTILDHASEKKWPRTVFIIYDEALERLMPWQKHWYRLLKKAVPRIEVYGVFHQPGGDMAAMAAACDILVCNRGFGEVRALSEKAGKELWCYTNCSADKSFGLVRFVYGQIPWLYGARAMFFWSYDYYGENPWNDFNGDDHGDASWVIVYPSMNMKTPVRTVAFMGLMEAVEDARYLATLEEEVRARDPGRWPALRDSIKTIQEKMLGGVRMGRRNGGEADFFISMRPQALDEFREYVIRELLR